MQYGEGELTPAQGAALVDVICHPTLSKVVAAMNDGTIRIFDAESGMSLSLASGLELTRRFQEKSRTRFKPIRPLSTHYA